MTFTITDGIGVKAPLERCFALSTNVELVRQTLGMRPVAGVMQGHVTAGSRVVWRGWKFGLPTEHHTLITQFAPPHAGRIGDVAAQFDGQQVAWFEDSQEQGRFATFRHLHVFRQYRHDVRLEDRIEFSLPLGWAGELVGRWIVAPHAQRLIRERFALIRRLAEGEGWREYVGEGAKERLKQER